MKNGVKQLVGMMILLSSTILLGCASTSDLKNLVSNGSAVSTSDKKLPPSDPNKVKLYYSSSENPKHYKVIGRISVENYSIIAMEYSQESIAKELKKQAASLGANGVINITSGLTQTVGNAIVRQ